MQKVPTHILIKKPVHVLVLFNLRRIFTLNFWDASRGVEYMRVASAFFNMHDWKKYLYSQLTIAFGVRANVIFCEYPSRSATVLPETMEGAMNIKGQNSLK
jgi:hypothetical protein